MGGLNPGDEACEAANKHFTGANGEHVPRCSPPARSISPGCGCDERDPVPALALATTLALDAKVPPDASVCAASAGASLLASICVAGRQRPKGNNSTGAS